MADDLQATNEPIAAEEDTYFNDADSALGTPSLASSTTSIGDSIKQYRKENGRTYHAYKEGKYIFPNDEAENDRLDLQHHLFALTFKNKLFLSPAVKDRELHRVLDVGTGTGIWAMDFADEHPESQVIGIDLSPIQPSFIPANVIFQIDDLEEDWTFKHKFDFIYSRMMVGSFADWPRFFEQAYENLSPGGFLELCDSSLPLANDDNTWPKNSALKKWSDSMIEGIKVFNRSAESPFQYEAQLQAAGSINIKKIEYKWPTNNWPKDKKLKELGLWNHENLCGGLGGISLRTFTQGLGWSLEETEAFLVDVRREFKDTRIHSYMPLFVIWGQKPPEA